ncbi:hypothetical protein RhiirA1_390780, partial [Rhizophagus irregularis]
MDVDKPLTPPGPVETTSTEIPSQPDISSLDTSQHAPANNNDKGKSPAITSAVSFPERAVSLDVSQAAVQSQPTLFYASAAPNDVEGFWTHFASNRDACDVVDRQLSLFSSYGSRATCSGSNDLKRIIVHFRKKNDLDTATASPMDSLFGLHFHAYDPQAIKAAEHMRTLVVTDIPLLLLTRFCVFFIDHHAYSSSLDGPHPTFFHANGSSRLDYIWSSPGFPAPGLFSQVVTCPYLLDRPFTDHQVLITVFDFSTCLAILAKSRLKQKKEMRTVFSYTSTSEEQWKKFTTEVDDSLGVYLNKQYTTRSDFSSLSLDRMWHALKAAIFSAAIETLPFHKVSNTHRSTYSPELSKLIAINKFLDRFLYRLTTRRPNWPTQISQMTAELPSHLVDLASLLPDYSIPTYSTIPLSGFKSFLRSQKNLVSAFLSTKFAQNLADSVEYYTALRDEHFSDSLGNFIDSALSVEKRSIILDRVLVVLDSTPTLLTDPSDIKQAAVAHFQSVVSPPLVHYHSIASFPPRWQKAYTPLPDVSASLYDPVLAPITLQEWSDVISFMPNNKASGPSKISYEMIKHLSGESLDFSLLLANTCLSRGDIPADWREAVVYPIPKPHDFDAQLKNTRPITLLETVRKCVVKVVTNRLSTILADKKILQGGNFAGLPGGSTD